MAESILVTGAAGYIGSHTAVLLQSQGFEVVGVDNFSNSDPGALDRMRQLTGQPMPFVEADIRDRARMAALFAQHRIAAVIHFAGLKAVGESVAQPLAYFDNNVSGTVALLEVMGAAGVKRLIFSSSATVYGDPESVPIPESARLSVTNPYGRTKLMVEEMLGDLRTSDAAWRTGVLRYFNPVGAHPSGLIGENPKGTPNNLMPFIAQVAAGVRPELSVFGGDYPTRDGTGVRDYIHVMDLAAGHVAAVRKLLDDAASFTVNLGTGTGYTVLEVVRAFEAASGRPVRHRIVPRRPGDVATCFADPHQAERLLGWRATLGLPAMCADHWRWQCKAAGLQQ